MPDPSEQLASLRELWAVYDRALAWGEREHHDDRDEIRSYAREWGKSLHRMAVEIQAAQRRLLQSGFEVPDSWLSVRAIGSGAAHYAEESCSVTYTGAGEPDLLAAACSEISVAITRLESLGGAAVEGNGDRKHLVGTLAGELEISTESLNDYTRRSGVTPPGRGRRNHRYTDAERRLILAFIAGNGSAAALRKRAESILGNPK